MFDTSAKWIWGRASDRATNEFVCFRRVLTVSGPVSASRLRITADARYHLVVNGKWIGQGPVRSWPSPWPVDEYDVRGLLKPGPNVLAVLVHRWGISTFQYLNEEPGLLAHLAWTDDAGEHSFATDGRWRCRRHDGYAAVTPRNGCQQAWEEQFDARAEPRPDWVENGFDDDTWEPATELRQAGEAPHQDFESRGIPLLASEPVAVSRVLAAEAVQTATQTWSLNPRVMFNPADRTANIIHGRMMLATSICSDVEQAVQFHVPHHAGEWALNGQPLAFNDIGLQLTDNGVAHAVLRRGSNSLLCRFPRTLHLLSAVLNVWTEAPVRFSSGVAEAGTPWLAIGPFADASAESLSGIEAMDPHYVTPANVAPCATWAKAEEIWGRGHIQPSDLSGGLVRPLLPGCVVPVDAFAVCSSERVAESVPVCVEEPTALQADTPDWTTIHPVAGPADVRLLVDFGDEVIGAQEFEIDAPAGAIIDFHNFEFIQPGGRKNLGEGMNNTFRYTCSEGIQRYRTFERRGFRYTWLSFRNFDRPLRIRFVRVLMSTYPQARLGSFACSDPLLERIWQAGVQSVKCCSEDTYTDCPSYEQVMWVGDARNEALVDFVANGDPRLSARSWLVAARSLDRSPLVESQVPSGWQNVLPAWSFLWMRWAREHYLHSGDLDFARRAMSYLDRNVAGLCRYVNRDGLFEFRGWNMFDWAPMDTPVDGIVTHLNCLAVLGLREGADLARMAGSPGRAAAWEALADTLAAATNLHLWDEDRRAYIDSIHSDGRRSSVFSQQTQTAAYISGVAAGERAERCRAIIDAAPPGFVAAGSPFFMFFLLEALVREQHFDQLVKTIRHYWGRQIDAGATTFWETYFVPTPGVTSINMASAHRLTRSHCHGWSAAPTFFLSQHVLGIQPLEAGYKRVAIEPQTASLTWARGRVPAPQGVFEIEWERAPDRFTLYLTSPAETELEIRLPVCGAVLIEEGKAELGKSGAWMSRSKKLAISVATSDPTSDVTTASPQAE